MATQKQDIDAIDLLTEQHREVEELFAQLEDAEGDEKEQIFVQLADKLAMHAKIEELHFYPAGKDDDTEDELLEAVEEHLAVKRVLADLLDLEVDDETFDAKCKLLQELVDHHVEEEEKTLFPKVRKVLDAEELVAIAQEMAATQSELEGTDPRLAVPGEIGEAAKV
jgi:hemerythrin superfamily protein